MPEDVQREAETLVDDVLYGVMEILDGVTRPIGNDQLDMELVLSARLRDKRGGEVRDVVELGPNGEACAWASPFGWKPT